MDEGTRAKPHVTRIFLEHDREDSVAPKTAVYGIGIGRTHALEVALGSLSESWIGVTRLAQTGDKSVDFRLGTKGADIRIASVGVLGFMICSSDDIVARFDIIERAFVMRDIEGLQGTGLEYGPAAEEA